MGLLNRNNGEKGERRGSDHHSKHSGTNVPTISERYQEVSDEVKREVKDNLLTGSAVSETEADDAAATENEERIEKALKDIFHRRGGTVDDLASMNQQEIGDIMKELQYEVDRTNIT